MINCFWNIPAELAVRPQWVCHNQAKVPLNVKTGQFARTTDPATWGSFDEAVQAVANGRYAGIGFVFSGYDSYLGVDLDDCFDEDKQLKPWAKDIVDALGSYTEISLSGKGLHIIVKAALPGSGKAIHKNGVQLEMYDQKRYFCMTGNHLEGTPTGIEDRAEEIANLYQEYFTPPAAASPNAKGQGSAYGWTALESECDKVHSAPNGIRNITLNTAALCLGQLVAGGELDESEVVGRLTEAAHEAGLADSEIKKNPRQGKQKSTSPKRMDPIRNDEEAVLTRLSDVDPVPIEWLWPDRIAIGKITILAGDPGLGKSFVSLDVAARVSTGDVWPDDPYTHAPTGSTILLSAEDDPGDTLRPRLDYLGADCAKIHVLQAVKTGGRERTFSLVDDLMTLEKVIRKIPDCRLIIVDPISAYLGTETDSHSNTEVRAILAPLATLAAGHRVAVVCVTHLNKGAGTNPLYRTMGSLAFTAAARTVWLITRDKDNDDGTESHRRLMLCAKSNISTDDHGLSYIVPEGHFEWQHTVNMSAARFFREVSDPKRYTPVKEQAKKWLLDLLQEGSVWADDIVHMARQEQINLNTLRAAKKEAGVVSERTGFGKDSKYYWRLPNQGATLPREGK
ncbi:MAG: DNA repair protein RadA [Firmicutes bacterium ADurb.Bin373]|nr:MAG: DNA repair protein RadA [Firmicutes bacterium ADurb.Bin373]